MILKKDEYLECFDILIDQELEVLKSENLIPALSKTKPILLAVNYPYNKSQEYNEFKNSAEYKNYEQENESYKQEYKSLLHPILPIEEPREPKEINHYLVGLFLGIVLFIISQFSFIAAIFGFFIGGGLSESFYKSAYENYEIERKKYLEKMWEKRDERDSWWESVCNELNDKLEMIEAPYKKKYDQKINDMSEMNSNIYDIEMTYYNEINNAAKEGLKRAKETLSELYINFPHTFISKYENLDYLCYLRDYFLSRNNPSWDAALQSLDTEIQNQRIISAFSKLSSQMAQLSEEVNNLTNEVRSSFNKLSMQLHESSNKIINQLKETNYSLNSISDNISQISEGIDTISSQNAVIAYNTERTKTELNYMNRMNYFAGRNNGTIFNNPPVE